jgi:hypothetical protein
MIDHIVELLPVVLELLVRLPQDTGSVVATTRARLGDLGPV